MRNTQPPIHLYNDDIIYEIFTWLPAKSLMRFKSINKFWNTKISSDSYFIKLHQLRSRARSDGKKLLLHPITKVGVQGYEHKFISTNNDDRNHITEYTYYHPNHLDELKDVGGFVCFYSKEGSSFSGSLHNLSTHESILLPEVSKFYNAFRERCFIFIGFDSTHTLCKILRKTDLMFPYIGEVVFEIYTVGGTKNSWRMINSPPFECRYCFNLPCEVCINGVLYWTSHCFSRKKCFRGPKIKAFDVSDEKFHLISIPRHFRVHSYLPTNVNGVLTLTGKVSKSSTGLMINLLKLEGYKNQVWVMESVSVDVAPELLIQMNCTVVGTVGGGEILVIYLFSQRNALIYYDRARRISKVVELNNPRMFSPSIYVESIMPLTSISN